MYLDASALIYATETPDAFPGLRTNLFGPFNRGELSLVTSCITLAEVLVRPKQLQDALLEKAYREFFTESANFDIVPVDLAISAKAAELRGQHGFKLPDAIHLATGIDAGCTHYITGDLDWAKAGVQVIHAGGL